MITASVGPDNELVIQGKVKEGDVYHGLCCTGWDFEVDVVIVSAFGHCSNPRHYVDSYDPYAGVVSFDVEDIALYLVDGRG